MANAAIKTTLYMPFSLHMSRLRKFGDTPHRNAMWKTFPNAKFAQSRVNSKNRQSRSQRYFGKNKETGLYGQPLQPERAEMPEILHSCNSQPQANDLYGEEQCSQSGTLPEDKPTQSAGETQEIDDSNRQRRAESKHH